jgi:hypothetical protein
MGVGDEDPADAAGAGLDHLVEVLLMVVRPGVDHGQVVGADQVGVGAGSGHDARVVGQHAPHERAQHDDLVGSHDVGFASTTVGSAARTAASTSAVVA